MYIELKAGAGLPGHNKILCGKYLLPCAGRIRNSYVLNPQLPMTSFKPSEDIASSAGECIMYWNIPKQSGVSEIKNEKYLSKDVNALLRKWGYIQGKEK